MLEQIEPARDPWVFTARDGHLTVAGQLARGGTATIYQAEDHRLHRAVAMKRLDDELARYSDLRDRFLAEAQITTQLEHPNVVPVHDIGETADGVPYFTMKVVPGITFEQWLLDPSRPVGSRARVRQGITILLQICDALVYAHGRGVIHRDLKPENVIVGDDGRVYLIDWGLARLCGVHLVETDPPHHDYVGIAGTPGYMSPEQARGNPLQMDHRSDVFGVGAMLYEIVSGCGPYGRTTDRNALLLRAWKGEVVPIEHAVPGAAVSPQLLELVGKTVAVERDDRPQSVLELQRQLRALPESGGFSPSAVRQPGRVLCEEGAPARTADPRAEGRRRVTRSVAGRSGTGAMPRAGESVGSTAPALVRRRLDAMWAGLGRVARGLVSSGRTR